MLGTKDNHLAKSQQSQKTASVKLTGRNIKEAIHPPKIRGEKAAQRNLDCTVRERGVHIHTSHKVQGPFAKTVAIGPAQ